MRQVPSKTISPNPGKWLNSSRENLKRWVTDQSGDGFIPHTLTGWIVGKTELPSDKNQPGVGESYHGFFLSPYIDNI